MTSYKNRLVCAVSAVASAGLGAFTVSTASAGYVTFAAGDDGKSFDVVIVEGTTWEVRTGCVYTHSGTSLARGTLEASSTGSAIAFSSAAVLTVTPGAAWFTRVNDRLYATPLVTVSSSGTTLTTAADQEGVVDVTLTGNCTISFTGVPSTGAWSVRIILRQDGTGSRTVSWPGSTTWLEGSTPSLQTAASAIDVVELQTVDAGSSWIGRSLRPPPPSSTSVTLTHIQNNGATTQTLSANAATKIAGALTSVVLNPGTYWDTTNKKFTPTVAGKYLITAGCQGGSGVNSLAAQVYKNGSQTINGAQYAAVAYCSCAVSDVVDFNGTTDYAEFYVWNTGTSVTTNAAAMNTYFKAVGPL